MGELRRNPGDTLDREKRTTSTSCCPGTRRVRSAQEAPASSHLPDTEGPGPEEEGGAVGITASNHAHVDDGRAVHRSGQAYAVGSEDPLGLWNTAITTSLTTHIMDM